MKNKTRNDIILAGILLLLAAAGFLLFTMLKSEGDIAAVIIDGKEVSRYPLDAELKTVITTESGVNTLVIKDGVVYIRF